jgi:hypothetical protein
MNTFNKYISAISAVGLALSLSTTAVSAAPYLFGPDVQLIEDEDAEVLLNRDGTVKPITASTRIEEGDLFAGVFKYQATKTVNDPGPGIDLSGANTTFSGAFLIKALSVTAASGDITTIDNSFDTLTFGAASQAEWDSVFGDSKTIDIFPTFDVANINGSGSGIAPGTMALFFNDVVYNNAIDNAGTLSSSATSFIAGGSLQYEAGFTGGAGTAAANQFWSTKGLDAAFPSLTGTNNPTNRFAIDITKQWAGPNLLAHNYLGALATVTDSNYTGPTQFQSKGDFAKPLGQNSPWGLGTDTDTYIHAVPEPASLAVLAVGLLGFGLNNRRTRKAA